MLGIPARGRCIDLKISYFNDTQILAIFAGTY